MQTAIMTIFQFTPEEVVEIRVGDGREEVMSRSERISGDEGCVCCEMRVVVVFRVSVVFSVIVGVIKVICFEVPR